MTGKNERKFGELSCGPRASGWLGLSVSVCLCLCVCVCVCVCAGAGAGAGARVLRSSWVYVPTTPGSFHAWIIGPWMDHCTDDRQVTAVIEDLGDAPGGGDRVSCHAFIPCTSAMRAALGHACWVTATRFVLPVGKSRHSTARGVRRRKGEAALAARRAGARGTQTLTWGDPADGWAVTPSSFIPSPAGRGRGGQCLCGGHKGSQTWLTSTPGETRLQGGRWALPLLRDREWVRLQPLLTHVGAGSGTPPAGTRQLSRPPKSHIWPASGQGTES